MPSSADHVPGVGAVQRGEVRPVRNAVGDAADLPGRSFSITFFQPWHKVFGMVLKSLVTLIIGKVEKLMGELHSVCVIRDTSIRDKLGDKLKILKN